MEARPRTLRPRRSSPLRVRDDAGSLLIGPGGQIIAAEPAKDNPRVTGLLPEGLPSRNRGPDSDDGDLPPTDASTALHSPAVSDYTVLQTLCLTLL